LTSGIDFNGGCARRKLHIRKEDIMSQSHADLVKYFMSPEGQKETRELYATRQSALEWEKYFKTPEGMARQEATKLLWDNRPRPDALDRATELAAMKMNQVPPLALDYFNHLASRFGSSGEVIYTAYEHYAQYAEGLPNPHGEDAEAAKFFSGRGALKAQPKANKP
jgi:hypothetical protein